MNNKIPVEQLLKWRLAQAEWEAPPAPECFEATFISDKTARPILSAQATHTVDCDYRMDAELSEELVHDWATLKVTDRMPFRLILRTHNDGR